MILSFFWNSEQRKNCRVVGQAVEKSYNIMKNRMIQMRVFSLIIALFLITGCNQERVEIRVDRLNGDLIYYSIINHSKKDIQFLKPMKYLCYSDSLKLKKEYAILSLGENTDSGFFSSYSGGTMPDFEHSDAIKDYLDQINGYKNLSNYKVITVKKGQSYTDSLLISIGIDSPCALYPEINEKTVMNLSGGELNMNLNSKYILDAL